MRRVEGFTMIEMLVIMTVLIMMATAILKVYDKVRTRGEVTALIDWARSLETAAEAFRQDLGYIPRNFDAFYEQPDQSEYPGINVDAWDGPYLPEDIKAGNGTAGTAVGVYAPNGKLAYWCFGSECNNYSDYCSMPSGDTICYGFVMDGLKKDVVVSLDKKIDKSESPDEGMVRYQQRGEGGDYYSLCYFIGCYKK